jgi:tripartite-type tricarboxylate transporter receptor subunit TctC
MHRRIRNVLARMAIAAVAVSSLPALAQLAPGKPLLMRVAYPAGGPADVAARQLQPALQAALGRPVIVDDQPGAGGSIAANAVLAAPADGHTLLVTTGNDLILAPLAIAQVRYKPDSYRLLMPIFPTDFVLVSSADHNFTSVEEFVDAARRRRDKPFSSGSWGYGSAPFLVSADFSGRTGAPLLDVPYKGAAPVITALLGREIDVAFVPLAASVLDYIRTGRIKPIGVASSKRNPFLPNVPTLNEGKTVSNFAYTAWAGVFIPASVPEPVAVSLQQEFNRAAAQEGFAHFLKESAALPVEPMTLQQAAAYYRAELEKFRAIARKVDLKPQ